jgi:hypothetical protein
MRLVDASPPGCGLWGGGSRPLPSAKTVLTKSNEGTNEGTLGLYQTRPDGIFLCLKEPAKSLIPLALPFCHGSGRGFEPRRPRRHSKRLKE